MTEEENNDESRTVEAEVPAPRVTAQQIEKAMADATITAMAEGVTDPEEILKRKLAARDELLAKPEEPKSEEA